MNEPTVRTKIAEELELYFHMSGSSAGLQKETFRTSALVSIALSLDALVTEVRVLNGKARPYRPTPPK